MPSLIWHLVKKDFRHLRHYLAVWWSILVCSAVVAVWQFHSILQGRFDDNFQKYANGMEGWFWLFVVLDVVMLAVVVDALLKNDSPIDEKAFWRTRPIGKARMFGAKLASLALFCFVVPGIIQAAQHLAFGFNVHEYRVWLGQFELIQGGLVAVVACAALLYRRTIHGVIIYAGLALALFIAEVILDEISPGVNRDIALRLIVALQTGWDEHPGLLFAIVLVVAALMYAGQSRRVGKLALLCGLLLNWAVGLNSTARFDVTPTARFEVTPYMDGSYVNQAPPKVPRNDAVKLSVSPRPEANIVSDYRFDPYSFNRWQLYGWINNPSFPELKDSVWRIYQIHSQLSWTGAKPDTSTFNSAQTGTWGMQPAQLINAPTAFAALGYGRLAWETVGTWQNFPLALVDAAHLARIETEPAKLTAEVYVESGQLTHVAEIPATRGATWRVGMTTTRLRSVNLIDLASVELKMEKVGPWRFQLDPSQVSEIDPVFLLYNSKTQECVEGTSTSADLSSSPAFAWEEQTLTFHFANHTDATGQRLPDFANLAALSHWLADARLVELSFVPGPRFYVPVTIDPFLLPERVPPATATKQN